MPPRSTHRASRRRTRRHRRPHPCRPAAPADKYLIPTTNNDQAFGLPLYQAPYGQLDGSIFYDFTDKFRVGLEATNLTNSYTRQIMEQHAGNFTRQVFMSGPRYTLLAQYSF